MTVTPSIAMTRDVAALIGDLAERVENRSLLLDKFLFHKQWPIVLDEKGDSVKWDDASRWSLICLEEDAGSILNSEANEIERRNSGSQVSEENRQKGLREAEMARKLAKIHHDSADLASRRAEHTRRFLPLFLSAGKDRCAIIIGQNEGRLALNLSDGLIQNAGMSLDRLFGMPCIPGSAIKGVSRHAALNELKSATSTETAKAVFDDFRLVFGTSDADFDENKGELRDYKAMLGERPVNHKGCVSFLPAYPVNHARVVVDLVNVHYPEYYKTGDERKLGEEKPLPNYFPCVETGAQFAFCLMLTALGRDGENLLARAREWLEIAITVRGLGGKTAAGYGWFSLKPDVLARLMNEEETRREELGKKAQEQAEKVAAETAEKERMASLTPEARASEIIMSLDDQGFAAFAKSIAQKQEHEKRAFQRCLSSKAKRERLRGWKKNKPELISELNAVFAALNLPPLP